MLDRRLKRQNKKVEPGQVAHVYIRLSHEEMEALDIQDTSDLKELLTTLIEQEFNHRKGVYLDKTG